MSKWSSKKVGIKISLAGGLALYYEVLFRMEIVSN